MLNLYMHVIHFKANLLLLHSIDHCSDFVFGKNTIVLIALLDKGLQFSRKPEVKSKVAAKK